MMLLSVTTGAGGLKKFVQSLKDCNNDKEAETKRVTKELANIRSKFSSSANLSGYQKKKYVWKLVYIFMLGHEVDFGHMEVLSLRCCSFCVSSCWACFLLSWRGVLLVVLPLFFSSCLCPASLVLPCLGMAWRGVAWLGFGFGFGLAWLWLGLAKLVLSCLVLSCLELCCGDLKNTRQNVK
jgi:hypothetical protein